jgi:hypothetical protein
MNVSRAQSNDDNGDSKVTDIKHLITHKPIKSILDWNSISYFSVKAERLNKDE